MRTITYIVICMLIVSSALLYGMSVPSLQTPVKKPVKIHPGGSSGMTAGQVMLITLYAGMVIAGTVKLTDDDPDNNLLGCLLISPLVMEGILFLILDESEKETVNKETIPEKING